MAYQACMKSHGYDSRIWILGASDPEMIEIERLLDACRERHVYAMGDNGNRVHPGNAYQATLFNGPVLDLSDDGVATFPREMFFVECAFIPQSMATPEQICALTSDGTEPPTTHVQSFDHHREGDAGFGGSPMDYFGSSSVGQVATYLLRDPDRARALGWERVEVGRATPNGEVIAHRSALLVGTGNSYGYRIPQEVLMIAASDHCLAAAYQQKCPGIDPLALMEWRLASRAAFQKVPLEKLMMQVMATRARIRQRAIDGIADLTDLPGGTLPEAPEAACAEGLGVLAKVKDRDGREKIVLLGNLEPKRIQEWIDAQAAFGHEVYGDPVRGYAGAYLTPRMTI